MKSFVQPKLLLNTIELEWMKSTRSYLKGRTWTKKGGIYPPKTPPARPGCEQHQTLLKNYSTALDSSLDQMVWCYMLVSSSDLVEVWSNLRSETVSVGLFVPRFVTSVVLVVHDCSCETLLEKGDFHNKPIQQSLGHARQHWGSWAFSCSVWLTMFALVENNVILFDC